MTNVFIQRAFDAFVATTAKAREALLTELKAQGVTTWEEAQPHAVQWVAKKYAVRLVAGQRKASGTLVLDSHAKNYETAKKALQRLREALVGVKPATSKAERKEVDRVARALHSFKAMSTAERRKFLKLVATM